MQMRRLLLAICLVITLCSLGLAQNTVWDTNGSAHGPSGQYTPTTPYGMLNNPLSCQASITPRCSDQNVVSTSGKSMYFWSNNGRYVNLGYKINSTSAPSTVSIVLTGYDALGNATVLGTYTSLSGGSQFPTLAGPFDHFTVTPTWTGGTGVSVSLSFINTYN